MFEMRAIAGTSILRKYSHDNKKRALIFDDNKKGNIHTIIKKGPGMNDIWYILYST